MVISETLSIFLVRALCAALFGILIGFERHLTGHTGGIKTNTLICLGACFFALISFSMEVPDKTRIIAQIVSGVSFLCSGVIFKNKESVNGLSTSATLWCSAAIGAITATGFLFEAGISTVILITTNLLVAQLSKIKTLKCFDDSEKEYEISITCKKKKREIIKKLLMQNAENNSIVLQTLSSEKTGDGKVNIVATFTNNGPRCDAVIEQMVSNICLETKVDSIGWNLVSTQ